MVDCPNCEQAVAEQPIEIFRGASLYCCPVCELQFWHPVKMPGQTWHELFYQKRDKQLAPLETGHRLFLSDSFAPKKGRMLDVGCGVGTFLVAARDAGYEVVGIELNRNAARAACSRVGADRVLSLSLEEFGQQWPAEKFDVVTFFEVLEHQDRPRQFLQQIKACLKPRGHIALSVPNRERWQKGIEVLDYPPNHVTRWNVRALMNFLTAEGFEILTMRAESLGIQRAAQVLSMGLHTGMVRIIAGQTPPTLADLAEMKPEQAETALRDASRSVRQRVAAWLVLGKTYALVPLALLLLPYFRFRRYQGLYQYCLARLTN